MEINANCLLAAFSKVLDVDYATLVEMIGHDGTEVVCPEFNDARRMRGFHIQEIIDACLSLDYAVTEIIATPKLQLADGRVVETNNDMERFLWHLNQSRGVVVGNIPGRAIRHALVNDGDLKSPFDGTPWVGPFKISEYYRVDKIT